MSEIRDRAEIKVAEILEKRDWGVHGGARFLAVKEILSIPEIAIVDREDKSLAQLLYMNATAEELYALGWVKEVQ